MKIIVLNCGSSSIKYQLFDMDNEEVFAKGVVEKIGLHGSSITNERNDGDKVKLEGEIIDHQQGIEMVVSVILVKLTLLVTELFMEVRNLVQVFLLQMK